MLMQMNIQSWKNHRRAMSVASSSQAIPLNKKHCNDIHHPFAKLLCPYTQYESGSHASKKIRVQQLLRRRPQLNVLTSLLSRTTSSG